MSPVTGILGVLQRKEDVNIYSFMPNRWRPFSFIFCAFPVPTFWAIWTASSEFGTYSLCEQRRFRRACASAQSRQNLRCSLIQAVSQEEPSDRKPDPWPLWMAGHAQLKFVMTECSKTQIRLTRLICLPCNIYVSLSSFCFRKTILDPGQIKSCRMICETNKDSDQHV